MEPDYLKKAVLATLLYYDIFDMPLTVPEIHNRLINPARLADIPGGLGEISSEAVENSLIFLEHSGQVVSRDRYYALAGRQKIFDVRVNRLAIAEKKWNRFKKISKWMTMVPYVRGFFASGSLALKNTDDDSDFDVLMIVKSGRLYTGRFLLWAISSLLGIRRKPGQDIAPDKLCFNHFMIDSDLCMRHQSLFNSQMYANLRPVFMSDELFYKFYSSNDWLNAYLYNFKVSPVPGQIFRTNIFGKIFSGVVELIFNNFAGDWIEEKLRKIQQKRISENPVTYESGGRVVFTETELEFHPRSFERVVIAKYNSGLIRLGIEAKTEERDSGLKP